MMTVPPSAPRPSEPGDVELLKIPGLRVPTPLQAVQAPKRSSAWRYVALAAIAIAVAAAVWKLR